MAQGISGIQKSQTSTSSAGKSFIGTVIARMPFSYQLIDRITELNPKYETFSKLGGDRESRVVGQSVFKQPNVDETPFGSIFSNKGYHELMYANIEMDKVRRLQDYRRMSTYAELADCIDEICDEVIVQDEQTDEIVKLSIPKDRYSKVIKEEIQKEYDKFIDIFDLDEKGWTYFRSFIVDGEYFFENIISETHPEYGIIGVTPLPTELINAVYDNVSNDDVKGYLLRKPVINPQSQMIEKDEFVVLEKNQVTYVHSGLWNEDKSIRLPYLENARRAYKQLSLVEDSIIIHRLVRAPEKLVFNVDTGNMNPPKSEAYLKKLMQQYWSKKTYDVSTNRVTNVYDPQSYLDAYWFAKRQGTEGTNVQALTTNATFGQIDDLLYFIKKLYKAMRVPVSRLNPEDSYSDGTDMTREELRFAKYLIRMQKQFSEGLKKSFITHLKLRNMYQEFNIKEKDIKLKFNTPTLFMMLKQQQVFEVMYNNFNNMSQNEGVANSFSQEEYLNWTTEQMARNREWRRRDAAFQWETEQILANGPAWKTQAQAIEQAAGEIQGMGGGAGGDLGGCDSALPDFGPTPEGGEPPPAGGEVPPEGGEAPPEGGVLPATPPIT
jgi:hypothetical protein